MSDSITENYNGIQIQQYTKTQQKFLKKAVTINKAGDLFCWTDFDMSNDNFRQKVFELKGIIECAITSNPAYYRVKGMTYNYKVLDHITLGGMGVGKKMQNILESVSKQPPAIHDIKLKFECPKVYNYLIKFGHKPNPTNKGIVFSRIEVNDHTSLNFTVYPKTITIDLACTYKPIIYDPRGALQLVQILERVRYALTIDTKNLVEISDPLEWIITQYHFNQDSTAYDGPSFHITVDEFSVGMVRYYSKNFPNGVKRIRKEIIKTPKRTVNDEIYEMNKLDDSLCSITDSANTDSNVTILPPKSNEESFQKIELDVKNGFELYQDLQSQRCHNSDKNMKEKLS
jgi:hypothetical protein